MGGLYSGAGRRVGQLPPTDSTAEGRNQAMSQARISVKDQAVAVARAHAGVENLNAHPKTSLSRLGAARDQLNIASTWSDPTVVWDAVAAIEASVLEVYGADNMPSTTTA